MIVLPLEVDAAALHRESGEGHILTLPHPVEAVIFHIRQQLNPIVAMVPGHSYLFEVVQEVDGSVGMLAETDHTQAVVNNGH